MTILDNVRRRDEELRAKAEVAVKDIFKEIVYHLEEKAPTRSRPVRQEYEWVFKFNRLTEYQMDVLERKVKDLVEASRKNTGTWVQVCSYGRPENAYSIGGFCEKKKKGLFSKKNPYDLLLVRIGLS